MGTVSLRVRPVFIVPDQGDIEWSISAAASVEQGEEFDITVTLDPNGSTREPGAYESIKLRTPTAAEFADDYPGETQAVAADFLKSFPQSIAEAAEGTGIIVTSLPSGQGVQLSFPHDVNELVFSREPLNHAGDVDDKLSVMLLYEPDHGTIVGGAMETAIPDDFVAPPNLVYTFDGDTVLHNAPAGTVVSWIEATSGSFQAAPTLVADEGGRFAIGAISGARYPIQTTGSPAVDFENAADPRYPITRYTVTVRGLDAVGGAAIDQQLPIRMQCPEIEPTGDETGTVTAPTTIGAFRNAINSTTSNRTIRPPTSSIDVWNLGGNISQVLKASNITVDMHHRLVPLRGGKIDIGGGTNIILRGGNFRAGGNDIAGQNLDDRDAGTAGHHSLPLEEVIIHHNTFANGVDETFSLISPTNGPWVRLFRFCYNYFLEPMYESGHSEGSHPFIFLVYNSHNIVVIHHNWIHGGQQRSPMVNCRSRGVHVFNNLVGHRSPNNNLAGMMFNSSQSTLESNAGGTAIFEANLLHPLDGPSTKTRSISINRVGAGSELYIPEGTNFDNEWFAYSGGFDFAPDPIGRSDVLLNNGSSASVLTASKPFEPHDYDNMLPTATAENKEDLFEHVLMHAGARARSGLGNGHWNPSNPGYDWLPGDENLSKVDFDAVTNYRTTGTARRQTPSTLQTQYGADWKGGSLGSMVDAAA